MPKDLHHLYVHFSPLPGLDRRRPGLGQMLRHRIEESSLSLVPRPSADRSGPGSAGSQRVPPLLSPEAIAEAYYQLHLQDRSAWTFELDLRPWVERF